jgi:hypothetical protein
MSNYPPIPPTRGNTFNYASPRDQDAVPVALDGNPLQTILTAPRATMAWILYHNPTVHVLALAVVSGITGAPGSAIDLESEAPFSPLVGVLIFALLLPLFMIVIVYFCGWLFSVVGKWLGGTGTAERCRAATAWSYVPTIIGNILAIPFAIFVFLTLQPGGTLSTGILAGSLAMAGVGLITSVWSVIILSTGLAVAHRFASAWMGLLTAFLAMLLLGAVVIAAVFGLVAAMGR